ncbi:Rieske 2Fe-2S domain-containing protein [Streptomyces sp. RB6PN25]|uniref:Rieske 2Fe-2S domain-containing protein n=1 Tax=Streptomyces humicola TaxID=2953240 RepID=A0ABT1PRA7_9ACTN|nr:Rieske 2Fe-2S domain-containing protein [Streptomyces humicola]MCQ4079100.1 Rieske 2Fe-2S domain-containing protein [Streptomyces humicola]
MSTQVSSTWVQVTTLDELWEGEMLPVSVDETDVLVVNAGGTVVAFEDSCPHVGTALSTGTFDGKEIMCPSHEWTFTATTGKGINPAAACLRRYAVRIEGEAVYINLHDVLQEEKGMA